MSIFKSGMAKTRQSFFGRIAQMLGGVEIDDDTWDNIEAVLIQADMGVDTAARAVENLKTRVRKENIKDHDKLHQALKATLRDMLAPPPPMNISGRPLSIILVVGVNGSGKTTSIAKMANRMQVVNNRKTLIAAGDTFRAAAIEQLQTWGERINVPVIAGKPGSDPAAVVYDATAAAKARNRDILIIDTAGRLHTNFNLMEELAKIKSVSRKVIPDAPHEILLVLDGTTGQNALVQAKMFQKMVDVTGIIVTKLDSSAKGGMIFSIYNELKLPVHYIGLGEKISDLVLFQPDYFVESLFDEN